MNKLEKFIFYLLLFSIPFQTRKILWYSGWRFNEWQSVTLYATDLLLVILLCFWVFDFWNKKQGIGYKIEKSDYFLFVFIVVSAISIKNSAHPAVSLFQWLKLIEFSLFYFYLSRYALNKFGLIESFNAILAGGLFQAFIAISQFLKGSSLGLKYLGESILNGEIVGVASFYLPTGEKILRSYGTTPHPNVLAGFLFLALYAFYFAYLYRHFYQGNKFLTMDRYWLFSSTAVLFALFTTFSRVVIFAWFVSFMVRSFAGLVSRSYRTMLGKKEIRNKITIILWSSLAVMIFFGILYFDEVLTRITVGGDDKAVQERVFFAKQSFTLGINWFGLGMGEFVGWLMNKEPFIPPYLYQPIHNIYLLIYSETGLLGILSFSLFIIFVLKDFVRKTGLHKFSHFSTLVFVCAMLFIGFFDHFLWTLQQGRFTFWLALSLLTFIKNNDIISG